MVQYVDMVELGDSNRCSSVIPRADPAQRPWCRRCDDRRMTCRRTAALAALIAALPLAAAGMVFLAKAVLILALAQGQLASVPASWSC